MSDQFGGQMQPPTQPPGPPMPTQYQQPMDGPLPQPAPKKSGFGLGGCLIGCLVAVVLVIAVGIGVAWYGYSWAKNNLLEDTRLTLQEPELTEKEQAALGRKIAPIKEAFENNTGELMELTLTQDELNWLMYEGARGEGQSDMRDFVMGFTFPADGEVSFSIGISAAGEGKSGPPYVNMVGEAEFEVENGKVTAKILSGRVGKWEVGGAFLETLNQNLSHELQNNPDMTIYWDRLNNVKIETGKVHLKLRALKLPEKTYAEKDY